MKHTGGREKRESHDRGLPESLPVPEDPGEEEKRGTNSDSQSQQCSSQGPHFTRRPLLSRARIITMMKDNVCCKMFDYCLSAGIYRINCVS